MRIRDLTCPLYEMAAFNYIRGSDDALAFYPNRTGRIPTTVVFPLDNYPKMAHNFIVLTIKPRVGENYSKEIGAKKRTGEALDQKEQVFLETWYTLIPQLGKRLGTDLALRKLIQSGSLTQLFPNIFKVIEFNDRGKLYHYLVTQGLAHDVFTKYLGDIPRQQAVKHGEKINNAIVFFPENMRPKRRQMLAQFLDSAHDVLQRNGIGDLFSGPITFARLPGSTIGDWTQANMQMRIQPNTVNDKTNFFTLIHEYGHKYWHNMMSTEKQNDVREKFLQLQRSGVKHETTSGILNTIEKAAEEIIKPGVQLEWIGRGRKFKGRWEITNVQDKLVMKKGIASVDKYFKASKLPENNEHVIYTSTMEGPLVSLLDKSKWKILNVDTTNIPNLQDIKIRKADIVSADWFPTKYSESKPTEWWAELFGIHMLGNLKGEPAEFMNQVMRR